METLKYASLVAGVSKRMFCPGCKKVMDVKNATEICVENEGKILALSYACGDCFDRSGGLEATEDLLKKNNVTFDKVEVLDGREADWEMANMMGMFS